MATYNQGFKDRMIQRMAGPESISATALSKEIGVAQATLSRWLKAARSLGRMSKESKRGGRSSRSRSAEDRLRLVMEASQLSDDDLGEFLRREGLHEAELREWMASAKAALTPVSRRARKASPEAQEIKELKKDLRRKEKALAEVTAILALKKKIAEIWGDEDDDTDARSGR